MTTITIVLLWSLSVLSGHTCCCSVAVPCAELSQWSVCGGRREVQDRREGGEVSFQSAVILFVLR